MDGIGGQVVVVVRQRLGDRAVDRAVGLFESDADVGCRARFIAGAQKSAIGQDSGLESRREALAGGFFIGLAVARLSGME